MFRKLAIAFAATAALGAAALAPTSASAFPHHHGWHHGWHGGFGIGFYGPATSPAPIATSSSAWSIPRSARAGAA